MKLSEMSTDRMMDALVVITPEVGEITKDKQLMAIFNEKKQDSESTFEFGINRIISIVPQICAKHRQAVYTILSALNGKSVEEIAAQKGITTIKEVKEALQDPELASFFS